MIFVLDTDVVVSFVMEGAPRHRVVRKFLESEVHQPGHQVGLLPQVLMEFLHVVTDANRFDHPLTMNEANRVARALWDASETVRILPEMPVTHRMLELIEDLGLGRKRILDTALAAALDLAGIRTLVTLNAKDYRIFSFLEVITPA